MISHHKIVIKSIIILLIGLIVSLLLGMKNLLPGFLLGMVLGTANFIFLESSVSSIFNSKANNSESKTVFSHLSGYFLKTIGKFVILALILVIFVKYIGINWIGLLAGFAATIFVFMSEVLKVKKCL